MTSKEVLMMIDEEEFRIRLNKCSSVDIMGMPVRQITLDEILDVVGYKKFRYIRDFVNFDIENLNEDILEMINEYMFDVKERLMMEYPCVGYDLLFDMYDMCLYVPSINELFIEFIQTFTYCEDVVVEHIAFIDEMLIVFYVDGKSNKLSLNRKQFEEFIDYFSILNYTVRVDRSKQKDSESVKEFDRKANEIKEKYGIKSKNSMTLESITSALIDSDNPNYTHESIGSKTIYQIMNSFSRMCKMKDNEFMNLVRVNCSKIDEDEIKKSSWFYNLY